MLYKYYRDIPDLKGVDYLWYISAIYVEYLWNILLFPGGEE